MNRAQRIERLLENYNNWNVIGKKELPFHFEIHGMNQILYYFGSNHSRNPENLQYKELDKYWLDFLSKTNHKDCVVLVEGGTRALHKNRTNAIINDSEAGLITFFAYKENITVESPEPDNKKILTELSNEFSKEEIEYYYFARMVSQWHRLLEPKPDFDEYINKSLYRIKDENEWDNSNYSVNYMKIIHKKIFNTEFNQNDKKFFEDNIISIKNNSRINKVSRIINITRDMSTISRMENLWNNKKSIFAVFGGVHPIMQENLLKDLLK